MLSFLHYFFFLSCSFVPLFRWTTATHSLMLLCLCIVDYWKYLVFLLTLPQLYFLRITWFYSNLISFSDLLTDLNDQLSCRLRWCISCIILFFSCPSSTLCLSWYSWINRANIVYSLPGFIKVPSSLCLSQYS